MSAESLTDIQMKAYVTHLHYLKQRMRHVDIKNSGHSIYLSVHLTKTPSKGNVV